MTKPSSGEQDKKPNEAATSTPPPAETPAAPEAPHAPADEVVTPPPPPEQPKPLSEEEATAAVYRYSGARIVSGVPPRDLTVLDVERLTPQERRDAFLSGPDGKALYEPVKPKAKD